jgi:hypothetical protein
MAIVVAVGAAAIPALNSTAPKNLPLRAATRIGVMLGRVRNRNDDALACECYVLLSFTIDT